MRINLIIPAALLALSLTGTSTAQAGVALESLDARWARTAVAGAAALSAALSSLPTVSDDAPFSCGVGTGGYSSRYAMGAGCAARLKERLSFNAGGSVLFGGSSDYGQGSLDTWQDAQGLCSSWEQSPRPTKTKPMNSCNPN